MARVQIWTIIEIWKACGQNSSEAAPSVGYSPAYCPVLGGPRETTLGVRTLAGSAALVHRSQTAEADAGGRGGLPGTGVARSNGLLSGEAGGVGAGSGAGGLSVDHSSVFAAGGLVRPSTKRRRPRFQNGPVMRPRNCPGLGYIQMDVKYVTPELSGLPYTCYLYAALDISTRVGPPKAG